MNSVDMAVHFGKNIESGKKTQARIKAMVAHMGITFGANEFKGEK